MKLLRSRLIDLRILISAQPTAAQQPATPADLRKLADQYYNWRNQQFPVSSSDAGLHTWDNKLTDYGPGAASCDRRLQVEEVLRQSERRCRPSKWSKDDRIDWLLFQGAAGRRRVL